MKFNLSQFKKVQEDDHTAVMEHPEGHHIVIAKSILSPKAMDELKKLPMHKASGGGTGPLEIEEIPDDQQAGTSGIQIEAIPQANIPNLKPTSDDAGMEAPSAEPPAPPIQSPESGAAEWNAPAAQNTAGLQNFALPPAPTAPPAPVMPQQDMSGMQKAVNEQVGGIYGEAAGKAKGYQADAKRAAATAGALEKIQAQYQGSYQQLQGHVEEMMKDFSQGHINPNHFVESMDTGKKVRTAIGLILGGMGGGLMRQGNPAMDFLNKQIDRDIASQQATLDTKKTLLSANMQQFGNLKDATDMTRVMQMGIMANQFQEAGAAAQSQVARGIAAQHAGALKAQMLPIMQQMAWRNALAQSANPMDRMTEEQKKTVVRLPDGQMFQANTAADAEKVKGTLETYSDIKSQIAAMRKFGGRTFPGTDANATADSMKEQLNLTLKNLFALGALSTSDIKMVDTLTPNPGDWNQGKVGAKLNALEVFLKNKLQSQFDARLPGARAPAITQQNQNVTGAYRAGRS